MISKIIECSKCKNENVVHQLNDENTYQKCISTYIFFLPGTYTLLLVSFCLLQFLLQEMAQYLPKPNMANGITSSNK